MKLFFASSNAVAIPIVESLLDSELITGLISNPDKPKGRKRELAPNDFAAWAETKELPLFKAENSAKLSEIVKSQEPECVLTCAYGRIIPKELLSIPKLGWLNIHFSLLPKLRGAAPVQRAILQGEKISGFTIFKMDDGLDTGPILYQEKLEITSDMTAGEFLKLAASKATEAIRHLLNKPESWKFSAQIGEATLAPKLSREEARVDWEIPAQELLRKLRAFDTNGGIHTRFRDDIIEIESAIISQANLRPGEILVSEGKLLVGTGDGSLELIQLKPGSKKSMASRDWLNGARLQPGEYFE